MRVSTKPQPVGVQTSAAATRRDRRSSLAARMTLALLPLASLPLSASVASAEASKLPPEIGYNYADVETARIAATSQAQRALSHSVSALYSNPANLVSTRVYHVAGLLALRPEAHGRTYGLAAVDSVTNSSVGAGFGINWSVQDPDGLNRDYIDARLGLAAPVSDNLSIGIAARYLKLTQVGLGPLGASVASSGLGGDAIVSDLGVDAGATITLSPAFSLALVGMNLNNPDNGFQPTSASVALGLALNKVSLGADLTADFTTWQAVTLRPAVGGETLLGDNYPLRAGYRYDDGAKTHAVSLGLGYVDTTIAVDLAASRSVSGPASTAVVATFSYFLESGGLSASPTDTF